MFTGILPQLLNPVDESNLETLFEDPAWSLSVKHDGERRMASNVGGEWFGTLHLPPLRERGQDLHYLLQRFLATYGHKYSRSWLRLTSRAEAYVLGYPYPGNIRQLESFVEQMAVFADDDGHIDIDALPEDLLQQAVPPAVQNGHAELSDSTGSIVDSERCMIEAALHRSTNIGEAARVRGIGRTTLWRKMREYNLHLHPPGPNR